MKETTVVTRGVSFLFILLVTRVPSLEKQYAPLFTLFFVACRSNKRELQNKHNLQWIFVLNSTCTLQLTVFLCPLTGKKLLDFVSLEISSLLYSPASLLSI